MLASDFLFRHIACLYGFYGALERVPSLRRSAAGAPAPAAERAAVPGFRTSRDRRSRTAADRMAAVSGRACRRTRSSRARVVGANTNLAACLFF